jgi:hypothetical protein
VCHCGLVGLNVRSDLLHGVVADALLRHQDAQHVRDSDERVQDLPLGLDVLAPALQERTIFKQSILKRTKHHEKRQGERSITTKQRCAQRHTKDHNDVSAVS